MRETEIYAAIGEEGFATLLAAFYRRIPSDPILGPMYEHEDLAGAENRLRDFLIWRCGGPAMYLEERGHPRLRMRHAPFAVDQAARDRWMELMSAAIDEAELPAEAAAALHGFLDEVATFLMNRGSPPAGAVEQ